MAVVRTIETMTLDGGIACLDFANSGYDIGEKPVERLHTYEDLVTLSKRLGLFPLSYLQRLSRYASAHQKEATEALHRSLQLRDAIFELFEALAHKRIGHLKKETLALLNEHLSLAQSKRRLQLKGKELVIDWDVEKEDLLHPLSAFILSSYELLTEYDHTLIKQCEGCRWLFLDSSKSHRRKWCNMQDCGSLHKAKRYYQKIKKKASDKS